MMDPDFFKPEYTQSGGKWPLAITEEVETKILGLRFGYAVLDSNPTYA